MPGAGHHPSPHTLLDPPVMGGLLSSPRSGVRKQALSSEFSQRQVAEQGSKLRPPAMKADPLHTPLYFPQDSHFLGFATPMPPPYPSRTLQSQPQPALPWLLTWPSPSLRSKVLRTHLILHGRRVVPARSASTPHPLTTAPCAQLGSGRQGKSHNGGPPWPQ